MRQTAKLYLTAILLLINSFNILSQESINDYLDSCTKYINLKRADEVIKFNLKAEKLISNQKIEDLDILYDLEFNYIWAFNTLNRDQLYIEHVKKMDSLITEIKESDAATSIYGIQNLNQLASVYIKLGKVDSAQHYFKKSYNAAKLRGEDTYISSAINNWGMYSIQTKGWDTAKVYFEKALSYLTIDNSRDSGLFCSINDNIADYHLFKEDTIQAISIIESNLKYIATVNGFGEAKVRWGMKLLQLYLSAKNFDEAAEQIAKLESIIPNSESGLNYKNKLALIDHKLLLNKKGYFVQQREDLIASKIQLLEDYLKFKRKTAQTSNSIITEYIQNNASIQLNKAKEDILAIKKERRQRTVMFLVSILILLAFVLILRVNHKRKIKLKVRENQLQQQELHIEKLEKEKINRELYDKSKDLSNIYMQTSLQEEWSQEVIEKLQLIRKLKKEEEKESQLKLLIRTLKQKSSTYKKIMTQQKGLDTADSAFFRSLTEQFPKLSRAEKETCGLIRLKLDSKEIAMIRNIHPSSVRKLRQRIRAKLSLAPDIDLYDFIQSI